ncbi:MAG TPA: hypothetical protein VK966_03015, partial [Longimicrobiales bacterium]|nr:hypothetical protein [Longimicrobiales bacterium]
MPQTHPPLRTPGGPSFLITLTILLAAAWPVPEAAAAQSLKIAAGDFGVGIGDVRRLDGLRINFRDRDLERVRGVNITVWRPH